MKRLSAPIVLALLLWGAATFGLAALAAEWRQDDVELGGIEDDVAEIRRDVAELKGGVAGLQGSYSRWQAGAAAVATVGADIAHLRDEDTALSNDLAALQDSVDQVRGILGLPPLAEVPTPAPTPTPTPEPVNLTAEAGVTVEIDGFRLTVEAYEPHGPQGSIRFILENSGSPTGEPPADLLQSRVLDRQGFVCGGTKPPSAHLLPGEKRHMVVRWNCQDDRPKTLILGRFRFFLPYVPRR